MKDEKADIVTAVIVAMAILVLMSMLPAMVSAQSDVKINEIMYNLPGTDTDREWVELYNNDTTAIDITGWIFYAGETNHDLTDVTGNMVIPSGGYAIIADDAKTFVDEHPECNCAVIDSSFSLGNSGAESIALKRGITDIADEVTYDSSWGANENGKTLERNATGGWAESLVDGGTPCKVNSKTIMIPFSIWNPPVIYTSNITVDAMNPENVGMNATTGLFNATEMIDNESYYVVSIGKPSGTTKMYISIDGENGDNLVRRKVTGISNLTFDPVFVMWDFPLMAGKTWTSTSNVTGSIINETGSKVLINSTAVVSGKVTAEEVTVPAGTFPCLVVETNISYDVAGEPTSNLEKYWMSPTDTGFLWPKYQSRINGELVEEQELIEVIPPTFLNASDNNREVNVTRGEFLAVRLETNPTIAYTWKYTWEVTEPRDDLVLQQMGGIVDVPEADRSGAGGVQIATFEVVGAGNATITMVNHRSGEPEVVGTFTATVTAS